MGSLSSAGNSEKVFKIGIFGSVDLSDPEPDLSWLRQVDGIRNQRGSLLAGCCCLSTLELRDGSPGLSIDPIVASRGNSVLRSIGPDLSIAADVELHNRADLIRTLAMDGCTTSSSDSELALAAYGKWGDSCADFLLGEFSFAVWDRRKHRLFCCRDHMGTRPFFYWRNGSRFAFASDPRHLLEVPGVPHELNRSKLALTAAPDGPESAHEETLHKGILSLPSGSWLAIDPKGVTQRAYWDPEISRNSFPVSEEDAFDQLRELLFDAVECRIRGKSTVTAFLSGGLDSSALVGIAARSLQRKNRDLIAISAVLPENESIRLTDERAFIDEFQSWPNLRIEYVSAPGRGPFDYIDDPGRFAVAYDQTPRRYLQQALEERAASRGADVILTGIGGEAGASCWGHGYYLELAANLRWLTLARELRSLHEIQKLSPARVLAGQIRSFLFPHRGFAPPLILAPDLPKVTAPGVWKLHWPSQRRNQADAIRRRARMHAHRYGPALNSIPWSLPFFDKRVLEFCLAAPGEMKVRNGYQRYLVRRALDGILPEKLQWRTGKCAFSPDYYVRYNAQIHKAQEFVAAIGPKDPVRSVVDVERLRGLIKPVDPVKGNRDALSHVPSTIYLICFLRQFPEFRF